MDKKPFIPHPIDTSNIELPDEVKQLIEQLARQVHEQWAMGRLAEGLG